jgi:hypothetical protein
MRITEVTGTTEPDVLANKVVAHCRKVATAFNVPQRELGAAMLVEGVALLAAVDGGVAALMRVRKLVDAFERRHLPHPPRPIRETDQKAQ